MKSSNICISSGRYISLYYSVDILFVSSLLRKFSALWLHGVCVFFNCASSVYLSIMKLTKRLLPYTNEAEVRIEIALNKKANQIGSNI